VQARKLITSYLLVNTFTQLVDARKSDFARNGSIQRSSYPWRKVQDWRAIGIHVNWKSLDFKTNTGSLAPWIWLQLFAETLFCSLHKHISTFLGLLSTNWTSSKLSKLISNQQNPPPGAHNAPPLAVLVVLQKKCVAESAKLKKFIIFFMFVRTLHMFIYSKSVAILHQFISQNSSNCLTIPLAKIKIMRI